MGKAAALFSSPLKIKVNLQARQANHYGKPRFRVKGLGFRWPKAVQSFNMLATASLPWLRVESLGPLGSLHRKARGLKSATQTSTMIYYM